jgi:carboxyl-terminal processing protease
LPILFFATLALGFVLGGMLNFLMLLTFQIEIIRSKLNKLIDFIDNEYVDNVNTDSIVNLTVDIFGAADPILFIFQSDQLEVVEVCKEISWE